MEKIREIKHNDRSLTIFRVTLEELLSKDGLSPAVNLDNVESEMPRSQTIGCGVSGIVRLRLEVLLL